MSYFLTAIYKVIFGVSHSYLKCGLLDLSSCNGNFNNDSYTIAGKSVNGFLFRDSYTEWGYKGDKSRTKI